MRLFHPRLFSLYNATQFPYILKFIIKYGWNNIYALNFQLVKYSCKFKPSVFTLTYRGIIERKMHNILNFPPYLSTTPSSVDSYNSQKRYRNYSPKIVNRKIFIPNLYWIKNISWYDNKKLTRRNIWYIKTSWKILIWIKQYFYLKLIKCTNIIEPLWTKQYVRVSKPRLLFK